MPPFSPETLPPFPPIRAGYPTGAPPLGLRPAGAGDLAFLRRLSEEYLRELAASLPFGGVQLWPFLPEQFAREHRYFLSHLPQGDFLVIEQAGEAVGRLYLDRRPTSFHIAEFGLLARARNAGIGSAVLRIVQTAALAAGVPAVTLNVDRRNLRAQHLYARHGFVAEAPRGKLLPMSWPVRESAA